MAAPPSPVSTGYELVRLANGAFSIRSLADGETFHPVEGPIAEAEALYVRQLHLRERMTCRQQPGAAEICQQDAAGTLADDFVIWDVGLGAGGNVLTAIRQLRDVCARLRIVSFDRTPDALRFAAQHAEELQFPLGFESAIQQLLDGTHAKFTHGSLCVSWQVQLGEFPLLLAEAASRRGSFPAPHAIFFDAFSPARNSEMWTLPLFENLFRCLDSRRPCSLATFSRSTAARVAMLLAGFFVGVGESIAGKEETTVAANSLELIREPLNRRWLERARISRNAEPLRTNTYRRAPLGPETWARFIRHPQFQ